MGTRPDRRLAWLPAAPLLLLPVAAWLAVPPAWPAWALMWALAFAIYAGCKILSWADADRSEARPARQCAYLLLWPGMDAPAFLSPRRQSLPVPRADWLLACVNLALGLTLCFACAGLVPDGLPYLTGWIGMVGIVLALHFGLLALLCCAFRHAGITARPLMDWPLRAGSLGEFWGRRWNTAFRDLAHRFLFRPLRPRIGQRGAILAGFLASGLAHEAAISVPAGAGYGGPTVYFAVQGIALSQRRTGRAWMFAILLVPLPLLFHPPFVERVILPFLACIGGTP